MATDWGWKTRDGGRNTTLNNTTEPLTLLASQHPVLSISAAGTLEAGQFLGDGSQLTIAGKPLSEHLEGKVDRQGGGTITGPLQVRGNLATVLPGPVDISIDALSRVVGRRTDKVAATLRVGDAVKINEKTYTVAAIDQDQSAFSLHKPLAADEPRTGRSVYTDTDLWVVQNGAGEARLVVDKSGQVTATSFAGAVDAQHLQGTLARASLPDLPANKITEGELSVQRIPNLPASKISEGELSVQRIPNLPASMITEGELSVQRIPNLPASKITEGELSVHRIPNLDAAKLTGGTLHEDRILALPVSKITGLQAALDSKLNASGGNNLRVVSGIVLSNGNIQTGQGFSVSKSKESAGLYKITFDRSFFAPPAAAVNQILKASGVAGGSTLNNAVIDDVESSYMQIRTGSASGSADDRAFSFVVIGSGER